MRVAPAAIFLIGYLRAIDGSNAKPPRDGKKHKATDEPQMEASDRQKVRETRIAEGLLDLLANRTAFSGNQRRCDAAGRAREDGCDPARHFSAELPQTLAPAAAALGRAGPTRGAKGIANRANPGEIELALEIAAARQDLSRHGVEHSL